MNRLAIALLILLTAVTISAQSDAKKQDSQLLNATPSVEQVLDKYVQALGGEAVINRVTTRVMKGEFSIPAKGYSRPVSIYAKAPNKYALWVTGINNDAGQGFDGAVGWDLDYGVEGLSELTGHQLAFLKYEAEFYKETRFRNLYPRMELKGKEKVGEHEAYVIEAQAEGLSPRRFYFDAQTGLLIRRDILAAKAQDRPAMETYYEDYREVDGVKLPFKVRNIHTRAGVENQFTFAEVKQNVPVDDKSFTKPGNQKPPVQ